jgi:uncharacterized protein YuzE
MTSLHTISLLAWPPARIELWDKSRECTGSFGDSYWDSTAPRVGTSCGNHSLGDILLGHAPDDVIALLRHCYDGSAPVPELLKCVAVSYAAYHAQILWREKGFKDFLEAHGELLRSFTESLVETMGVDEDALLDINHAVGINCVNKVYHVCSKNGDGRSQQPWIFDVAVTQHFMEASTDPHLPNTASSLTMLFLVLPSRVGGRDRETDTADA